jgi:hypothetical protein
MMIIDPDGAGPRSIDLEFTEGAERAVCLGISLLTATILLGLLTCDNKRLATLLTEPRP